MRQRRRARRDHDGSASAQRIIAALPPELRSTLAELSSAPIETVTAVFELLPFDQRELLLALDPPLAIEGGRVPGSEVRVITPTPLAREVIGAIAKAEPGKQAANDDVRELAENMAQRIRQIAPGTEPSERTDDVGAEDIAVVPVDRLKRLAQQVVARQSVEASLRGKVLAACLNVQGSVSVEEIARRTGLARALVSNAFTRLSEHGLVSYDRVARNQDERDAIPIHVNADQYCVFGVKILPNTLVGIVTDLRGEPIGDLVRRKLGEWSEPSTVVEAVADLVHDLRHSRTDLPPHIIGLGVELGGHINSPAGRVEYSAHLGWLDPVDLGTQLRSRTGLITIVENDGNALAVYEHLFGEAAGCRWFAAILLGEGVGAGLILNGQLVHGARGIAGEFGHMPVQPGGPPCRCGNHGCVEAFAGEEAVLEETRKRVPLAARPSTLAEAAALAEHEDEARHVFLRAGEAFGIALAGLLNLLNLELIVVYVSPALLNSAAARAAFEAGYEDSLQRYSFSTARADCTIRLRPLTWTQGPLGAAATVVQRFSTRPLEWQVVRTASDDRVTGDPAGFLRQPISIQAYSASEGDAVRGDEEATRDPLAVLRLHSADTDGV